MTDPDVTGQELAEEILAEINTLAGSAPGFVARHLVMAGKLLDEDPELAYQHTLAARRRAARPAVVREAVGLAAYRAGHYAEALADLRVARRMTGDHQYLAVMADCERGLGRPRRALDLVAEPGAATLDAEEKVELLIVAAGARRDLGEVEAAALVLQIPQLRSKGGEPWLVRLRYAYADALEAAGRASEARRWFERTVEIDVHGETDADAREIALRSA